MIFFIFTLSIIIESNGGFKYSCTRTYHFLSLITSNSYSWYLSKRYTSCSVFFERIYFSETLIQSVKFDFGIFLPKILSPKNAIIMQRQVKANVSSLKPSTHGIGFIGKTLNKTLEYITTKIIDIKNIINKILSLDMRNFKSTRLSSVKMGIPCKKYGKDC